ncbi:MAG: histidine phosphatase family protein [Acidobacteriota bacterium]|nr:histidine phosphatase family protein [Acidobacteriota bacterium]
MESTHLYLIRHGQSEGNAALRFGGHSPTPLSALGHLQAEATAKYLAKKRIAAIYSSDLPRCLQTAEPLAKILNLEIQTSAALRERNVGVLQGLTFDEARMRFPEDFAALASRNIDFMMSGGESYRQMIDRAAGKLEEILAWHAGESIAVFSHTGTIGFLILHLLGALNSLPARFIWIATKNCGITHFEFRREGELSLLRSVNNTRHLQGLQ